MPQNRTAKMRKPRGGPSQRHVTGRGWPCQQFCEVRVHVGECPIQYGAHRRSSWPRDKSPRIGTVCGRAAPRGAHSTATQLAPKRHFWPKRQKNLVGNTPVRDFDPLHPPFTFYLQICMSGRNPRKTRSAGLRRHRQPAPMAHSRCRPAPGTPGGEPARWGGRPRRLSP